MAVISAVILVDPARRQSIPAVTYAREFLDVRQVQVHARTTRKLRERCVRADYLLNFLSAPFVEPIERQKFKAAINFHPAPPEYPGVGSASLALYDRRTTHGVTAHLMTNHYDSGTILRVRRFPIVSGYRALFDRSLDETLILFKALVWDIAEGNPLRQSIEQWARGPYTRAEFEQHPAYMEVPA